jgi:hypothetical protein
MKRIYLICGTIAPRVRVYLKIVLHVRVANIELVNIDYRQFHFRKTAPEI